MRNPAPVAGAVCRRVCVVQRVVPHYRVPFFRALHTVLRNSGIELQLIHGQEFPGTVPRGVHFDEAWVRRVENRYIRIGQQELVWQPCEWGELSGGDLVVVEHANRLLLNYRLLLGRGRSRLAFWGHGANFQSQTNAVAEAFKRRLARAPDWWFAYTDGGARLVEDCGFPRERITVLNNSIDSRRLRDTVASQDPNDCQLLRERLRLPGRGVAIFCGRLVEEKRLDLLWNAAIEIRRRCSHFSLLVIGDGPLEPEARRMAAAHDWIHYLGARTGDEVAPYFAVSDFMLIPGLVGLVVVDAFAAALPLVTTCIESHSPEIEYLEPGVNGLLAQPEVKSLADACVGLLESPYLLEKLQAGCREAARVYTLEAMVERFAGGVRAALERGPRVV